MTLRDKLYEKLNYYAKCVYARYMGQWDGFRKGVAAANAGEWDAYGKVNFSSLKPGPPLPISAIMRVKDGQTTLMVAVEAIVHYCKEVILVDHASTDMTAEIMDVLVNKYPGRVKRFRYDKPTARAGMGYMERLSNGEGGSLAEYYNYCFSLGTEDYLLKWDADNLALPPFYTWFGKAIRKGSDVVYFDGVDVMGVFSCTNEARLFKRSLKWTFRDFAFCEGLVVDDKQVRRYSIPIPTFFHLRQFA